MLYYIRIDNRNIYVSKEIYKLYCKGQRKERYFRESDIHNRTFSYNALDTEDLNGCDLFQDTRSKSVEEQAEEALERSLLLKAMKGLDPQREGYDTPYLLLRPVPAPDFQGNRSSCNHASLPPRKDSQEAEKPHGAAARRMRRTGAAQIHTVIWAGRPFIFGFNRTYVLYNG